MYSGYLRFAAALALLYTTPSFAAPTATSAVVVASAESLQTEQPLQTADPQASADPTQPADETTDNVLEPTVIALSSTPPATTAAAIVTETVESASPPQTQVAGTLMKRQASKTATANKPAKTAKTSSA